jgi:hypothetical protein
MARGLKISHKETNLSPDGVVTRSSNLLHSQETFGGHQLSRGTSGQLGGQGTINGYTSLGATGGLPQWITSNGVKTVKVQYNTAAGIYHGNAYIIAQKGAKQFLVANAVGAINGATHSNASVTVCTLNAGADAANAAANTYPGIMTITGYNTSNVRFYVKRITSKYVYDFNNVRYRYVTSDNVATSTFANVECH